MLESQLGLYKLFKTGLKFRKNQIRQDFKTGNTEGFRSVLAHDIKNAKWFVSALLPPYEDEKERYVLIDAIDRRIGDGVKRIAVVFDRKEKSLTSASFRFLKNGDKAKLIKLNPNQTFNNFLKREGWLEYGEKIPEAVEACKNGGEIDPINGLILNNLNNGHSVIFDFLNPQLPF